MNKALFLDRDGTVIEHVHYLKEPEKVVLVPECIHSLTKARNAGYLLVVISNQSIIGRGTGTPEQVDACNAQMETLIDAGNVKLDLVLYCPHAPEDDCSCRKPKPGLLQQAANQLNINLRESVMIGDNITDIQAGENAQCRLNLYLNTREPRNAKHCFDTLAQAINYLLEDSPSGMGSSNQA